MMMMMKIMLLLLFLAHSCKAKGGCGGIKIDAAVVTAEAAREKHLAWPRREGLTDYGG